MQGNEEHIINWHISTYTLMKKKKWDDVKFDSYP